MYYYEFTILYSDNEIRHVSVQTDELNDQLAYCREGRRAGWITTFSSRIIKEEY